MNTLYQRRRPACLDTTWEPGAGLIWMRGETLFFENPRNRTMRFRRRFHLPFEPVAAEARVFADTHYRLDVNGRTRGRGPGRSDPTWTYYDRHDLTGSLARGDNIVAILVLFQGFGTGARISIMQGLLFQLVVTGAGGERLVLTGDRTWRASPAEEFVRPTPRLHGPLGCIEVQDTRLSDPEWTGAEYDDSGWSATDYVKADLAVTPWYHFVESPLPRRLEADVTLDGDARPARGAWTEPPPVARLGEPRPFPASCAEPASGLPLVLAPEAREKRARVVTMDFARIENGLFRLEISGPRGAVVDALFSDSLVEGDVIPKPEQARILTSRWILRGGRQTLEVVFNWLAFRHVQLWIWADGPVTLHRAWMRTLYYPLPRVEGFACDNPLLTRLDAICDHSMRLCFQDGIVDSPSREQQQWIGDARKTAVFNHHRWGDAVIHRNLIEQIGQGMDWMGSMVARYPSGNRNISPIPSYCLDWIGAFEDYHWYTGDGALIADWWPNVLLAIRWFSAFERGDGLLERVPHWLYIDLGRDEAGRGMGTGEALAALNLQYLAALRSVAGYAEQLGDARASVWFRSKADALAASIRAAFWNEERGCYADALSDGRLTDGCSEATASLALLCLESPGGKRAGRILSSVFDSRDEGVVRCSPFFMHAVLQALHRHGWDKVALELIGERYRPLIEAGATATWEHWQALLPDEDGDGYPKCVSSCHAWGAAPMAFFSGVVLGIRPTAAGWATVEIRPFTGDLTRASGACLTPRGLVSVRWEIHAGEFTLAVSAPEEMRGEVVLPDGSRHGLKSGVFRMNPVAAGQLV